MAMVDDKAMTLDDVTRVTRLLQTAYNMKPSIKFWLIDVLYGRFKELNGTTVYDARLQREIDKETANYG